MVNEMLHIDINIPTTYQYKSITNIIMNILSNLNSSKSQFFMKQMFIIHIIKLKNTLQTNPIVKVTESIYRI